MSVTPSRQSSELQRRRPDLADRQAAIARRHAPVSEDPEAITLEKAGHAFGQQPVLKAASAQHDRLPAHPPGYLQATQSQGVVEAGGQGRGGLAARQPLPGLHHPGTPVQAKERMSVVAWLLDDRNLEGPLLRPVGQVLEPHGGLGLVGGTLDNSQERGPGIEQTPGARRGHGGASRIERRGQECALGAGKAQLLREVRTPPRDRHPPPTGEARGRPGRLRPGGTARASQSGASCALDQQELAAPDRAVGPVSGAVPGDPQGRPALAVLGQAGHDVGVMVLDGQARQPALLREPGGEVVGMAVMDDQSGLDSEQAGQVGNVLDIPPARTRRVQVADVLAEEELASPRQRDRRLQVPSGRQQRRRLDRQLDPDGGQAAADPERNRPAADDPHDAVVRMAEDPSIVQDEARRRSGPARPGPPRSRRASARRSGCRWWPPGDGPPSAPAPGAAVCKQERPPRWRARVPPRRPASSRLDGGAGRSARPDRPGLSARPDPPRHGPTLPRRPGRARRTVCDPASCGRGAAGPPPPRSRRTADETRRSPSPQGSAPRGATPLPARGPEDPWILESPVRSWNLESALWNPMRIRPFPARSAGRTAGRRYSGRGTGGRPGRRTRAGIPDRAGSRASWSARDRTGPTSGC